MMSHPDEHFSHDEAAVWQAASLLSTLATAADVWRARRDRQRGIDPSEQEMPAMARRQLREAQRELQAHLMRLQAYVAGIERADEEATTALVRHVDALLVLGRTARLLHLIHQRLLSLYPDVPEALVEQARERQQAASRLLDIDRDAFDVHLDDFLRAAFTFSHNVAAVRCA